MFGPFVMRTLIESVAFFVQIVGTAIPILGISVLLNREQSKSATFLVIANLGCLVMNGSQLLMLQAHGNDEAMLALKMKYLGNAIFYTYFILFLCSYLNQGVKTKLMRCLVPLWCLFEIFVLVAVWNDRWRNYVFRTMLLMENKRGGFHYLDISSGTVYTIRSAFLALWIIGMLGYIMYKRGKLKGINERRSFSLLTVSQITIALPLVLMPLFRFAYDITPIFSAVAVLVIIVNVTGGDFFLIRDNGRKWVFENIEAVLLTVDETCGFLDANTFAKKRFPVLKELKKGEDIPKELKDIFIHEKEFIEIGEYIYYKVVLTLDACGKNAGYCLILTDETKQVNLMKNLEEEKSRAEDANRAKSDFISHMSHEIRTPMNAIIGMTEIMLREDLSQKQQGYLMNIKHSGAALLAIINDILDLSKIESGKLEIVNDSYEPMSMLSDLSLIFLNRIGDKPVELLFDIDSRLPEKLYGDSLRLRQVIINLVNNAIKFTETGYVTLTLKTEREPDGETVTMYFSVKDTGQGIRERDLGKLFYSFQQIDVEKNRNKEGTGLGLSISKQLVELMGGKIGVRSRYGEGSEFYFHVVQKVQKDVPAAALKPREDGKPAVVSCRMDDKLLMENLEKLAKEYGCAYVPWEEGERYIKEGKKVDFFFIDDAFYPKADECLKIGACNNTETCVLQNPMNDHIWDERVTTVNKPLYSLNFCQVINHEFKTFYENVDETVNFKAPEAKVLIVDDNEMNLKVATGMLQPLEMQIDTADSGKTAIKKLGEKKYDLVFMDHMMPVMDGVETTEKIRAMGGEYYGQVPIIALTANAMSDSRAVFQEAGMNDFVAKPIEMRDICAKIKKWLPKDLIQKTMAAYSAEKKYDGIKIPPELKNLEGIDAEAGIKASGGLELYLEMLGDFCRVIELKAKKIEDCVRDNLIKDYTTEVHSLKSSARLIGATALSADFYEMEKRGNEGDMDAILEKTPGLLADYRHFKEVLKPFAVTGQGQKETVSKETIKELLQKLAGAMDDFNLDGADEALEELEKCLLPKELEEQMESLRALVADVAMDDVIALCRNMEEQMDLIG